jgi:hypothetical protein
MVLRDVRSAHAEAFGGGPSYVETEAEVLERIAAYVSDQSDMAVLPSPRIEGG